MASPSLSPRASKFSGPITALEQDWALYCESAVFAQVWTAMWLYFVAPVAGMLLDAEVYVRMAEPAEGLPGVRHYFSHRHLIERL